MYTTGNYIQYLVKNYHGKEFLKRIYIYIYIYTHTHTHTHTHIKTKSLCYTTETNPINQLYLNKIN